MNKNDLKIVFLGNPEFAAESLSRIHAAGFNVAAVVTMPDKHAGRGHRLIESPVKQFAVANGIKTLQPEKLRDPGFIDELRAVDADIFVVIAFRMLPEVVWQMPRLGTFNLHASLLPRYRGAAPINRAVMNGDSETGVTTFFLKHEIDTGDIIDRRSISVGPDENVGSVHDRLMDLGADLTVKTLESIVDGTFTTTPQHELCGNEQPTPAPKIFKEDCRIDWNRTRREIHNHVRGLSPYPAAWTELFDGDTLVGQVKIFTTRVPEDENTTSDSTAIGKVEFDGSRMMVATSDGPIEVVELQLQGKQRMGVAEFMRGRRISTPRFE
ncbi:MAG: methionyl-tRNA formyltransferase [Paramuribaculum sp.]|nr:methionyl-tRNA formyltransferase [Paramuribaculum sp.]